MPDSISFFEGGTDFYWGTDMILQNRKNRKNRKNEFLTAPLRTSL